MTNEQAIKIATVVWGWTKSETGKVIAQPGSYPHLINRYFDADDLKREMESWQGFGHTVEAAADKILIADDIQEFSVIYEAFLVGNISKEQLWDATNRVALEACEKGGAGEQDAM